MIKKENVPNFLCYLRIAAAPFVMALLVISALFTGGGYVTFTVLSGVVFGAAMITDALDGHYARKYGLISDKGKILDPLADKVLILGAMFAFMLRELIVGALGLWFIIPLSIIVAREVTVSLLRKYTAKKGAVIGASIWGKVKTCVQSVAVAISYFAALFNLNTVIFAVICLAGAVTLISLFPYLKMYLTKLKELEGKNV